MASGGKPWGKWWWMGRGSSRIAKRSRYVVRDKFMKMLLGILMERNGLAYISFVGLLSDLSFRLLPTFTVHRLNLGHTAQGRAIGYSKPAGDTEYLQLVKPRRLGLNRSRLDVKLITRHVPADAHSLQLYLACLVGHPLAICRDTLYRSCLACACISPSAF